FYANDGTYDLEILYNGILEKRINEVYIYNPANIDTSGGIIYPSVVVGEDNTALGDVFQYVDAGKAKYAVRTALASTDIAVPLNADQVG
ncbi:hypothetical protein U2444_14735, partial [Listeria monocytogenes]|uniref:hypothetical protein n=1 Tax=Listeria monocytogenes TaxID=1639 RepID=UPI002FDC38FC